MPEQMQNGSNPTPQNQPHDLAVTLLAGGKSSRMGRNKAFVTLGERPLIEHILARVRRGLPESPITLIANDPAPYAYLGLPTFADVIADKGALGGIYTALHHSPHPYTLVIACDMPFISPALLHYMGQVCASTEYDAIVPRANGRPQGLLAIYSAACKKPVQACIDADRLKVIAFYDSITVRYLDPADYAPYDPRRLTFFNINTPDDLATARKLAQDAP